MRETSRFAATPRILIVGGSLAGLLAAHALAEAEIPGLVLERAGAHRPSGAALAVEDDQLLEALGPQRTAAALGRAPGRGGGALPASWTQLHRGLSAAAENDPLITLRHDTTVIEVGEEQDHAWATLSDGIPVTGAAVIGADGYRSVVRRSVDPQHPDSIFAGYTLWLGVAREVDVPHQTAWPRSLDFRSAGGHHLLGYPLAAEDASTAPGRRRLGWAWYDASRNDLLRSSGSIDGHTVRHSIRPADIPEQVYAELAHEAQHYWPAPWREAILDSIARRAVTCTPIAEYLPDRLSRGRLALVGDAAHVPTPMTGQGFAASIDDAAALAAALRDPAHRSTADALASYAAQRLTSARELVTSGQRFSRSFAR